MIYELYENDTNNEKSLKELLLDTSRAVEKLMKELIVLVTTSNLIRRIRDAY